MVEQAAASLDNGYSSEQLYALRVGVRRIRSLLKSIGSPRARRFRKTWRGFAAVTNRARDWDVFLAAAAELLPPGQFASFERRNRERVGRCHEAVIDMLESGHWRRHLQEWRRYLRRCRDDGGRPPRGHPSLARALSNARAALALALERGDDRCWHKFRIAVKEVRYQAESGTPEAERTEIVEQCKILQSLLGSWHDCVVQLQMLGGLEHTPEHDALLLVVGHRREQRLAEIESAVTGHSLFASAGNPNSNARSRSLSGS